MFPWRENRVFDGVMLGSGIFFILTLIAMYLYPGGTMVDASTQGYSFFQNFFSELGFLNAHGHPNLPSAILFFTSLTLAALGMGAFFLAFPRFFQSDRLSRNLAALGSLTGILSAICFIAIACVPGDVNLPLHKQFVVWAFRLFLAAVFCYTILLFRGSYPRPFAWIFVIFFFLLAGYVLLIQYGPLVETHAGMVIQAAGQKIIVYAAILTLMLQSYGARSQLKTGRH